MSDFMRKSGLKNGKAKGKKISMADPKLLTEIARVGNLLNQITRVVNTHAKSGYPFDHFECLAGVNKEMMFACSKFTDE